MRAPWRHFQELKDVIRNCPLMGPSIEKESDFEIQLAAEIYTWSEQRGLPVRILYYNKKRGRTARIFASEVSPYPIFSLGGSSWPDIGVYARHSSGLTPPREDYWVAIEAKIIGKRHSPAASREWIWNGIGQALVNGIGYQHSILAVLDFRRSVDARADEQIFQEIERRGDVSVIVRRAHD